MKSDQRAESVRGKRRIGRTLLALVLLATAVAWPFLEIAPQGATILVITPEHGIDVGDLPALIPLTLALFTMLSGRRRRDPLTDN